MFVVKLRLPLEAEPAETVTVTRSVLPASMLALVIVADGVGFVASLQATVTDPVNAVVVTVKVCEEVLIFLTQIPAVCEPLAGTDQVVIADGVSEYVAVAQFGTVPGAKVAPCQLAPTVVTLPVLLIES